MAKTYGAENFGSIGNEDAKTSTGMFASFWKSLVNSLSSVDKSASLANSKIAVLFENLTKYGQSSRNLKPIRQYFLDVSKNIDELNGRQIKLLLQQTGQFTEAMEKAFNKYGETGVKSKEFSAGLKAAGKSLSRLSDTHLIEFTDKMQQSTAVLSDAISKLSLLNSLNSEQDWKNVREGLEDTNQLLRLEEETLRRIFIQYGVLNQEIDEGLVNFKKTQTVTKELLAGLSQLSIQIHRAPIEQVKQSTEIIQTTRRTFKELAKTAANAGISAASSIMLVFKPLYDAAVKVDKDINQISKSTDALMDPEARKAFITATSTAAARSGADLSEVMTQVAEVASDLSLPISATAAGFKNSYGKINPVLEKYISTARKLTKVADIGEESLRKMYKAFRAGKSDVADNQKVLDAFAGSLAFLRSMNGMTKEDAETYAESVSDALTNMRIMFRFTDDQAINLERQMLNLQRSLNEFGGAQTKFLAQDILKNLTGSQTDRENLLNLLGMHPSTMEQMLKNQDLTPIRDAVANKFEAIREEADRAANLGTAFYLDESILTQFGQALAGDAHRLKMIKQSYLNFTKDGALDKFRSFDYNTKVPDITKKYDKMSKSLSNVVNRIGDLGEKLAVNFGEPLGRVLAPILRVTADAFEWFINQLDRLPDSIKFLLGLTAGLMTLGSVSGAISTILGGGGIFGKFFGSLAALGTLKVALVIAAVVAALYALNWAFKKIFGDDYLERFKNWFIEGWEDIVTPLGKAWDAAVEYMEKAFTKMFTEDFWSGLWDVTGGAFLQAVKYYFGDLFEAINKDLEAALNRYITWKESIIQSFEDLKKRFWDIFTFDNLDTFITMIVQGVKTAILKIKDGFLDWFGLGTKKTEGLGAGENLSPSSSLSNEKSAWGKLKSWTSGLFSSQDLVPQVAGPTIPSTNPLTASTSSPQNVTTPVNLSETTSPVVPPLLPLSEFKPLDEKLLKEMINNLEIIASNTKDSPTKPSINTWTPRPFTDAEYYTQSMADAARRNNTGG